MAEPWQIGDLARQDLYPDERGFQPPPAIPASTGEGYAGLGGDPSHLATTIKNWWTNQPSWLQRAQAENQKTSEAFQRGGMGEIAKQLATDTTEPQELYGAFGVGNIKGVRPPVVPGALAATSEYRPPFYSAVEQAVQGAKQNAAPGQQWAGFLRNQPGVKPEEVEALKLGELFKQPTVSKETMLGEIAANRVNVKEIIKGSDLPPYAVDNELQKLHADNIRLTNEYEASAGDITRRGQITDEMNVNHDRIRELTDINPVTKFSSYTLPGGENYREMLLTLPTEDAPKAARMTALEGKLRNAGDYDTHEVDAMRREYKRLADETRASGTFQSSHYDEPNILAHVRYNDRVIDGKKTLFVEEVQSDWHQKGKREGYQTNPRNGKVVPQEGGLWKVEWEDGTFSGGYGNEGAAKQALLDRRSLQGVPDAPFKTTWPELAMKRIIREAAEKGYDKVAWTPGSVQSDRYKLSNQLKELQYMKNEDGTYQIAGTTKHGEGFNHPDNVAAKDLEGVVGKEMAEKIIKDEGKRTRGQNYPGGYFDGIDLEIGNKGMKGFYDEILPATVNKLVKKHGGRVQTGELPPPRESFEPGSARAGLGDVRLPTTPVHTLDITPSLRAAAMKGFPLFSAGGVAATGAIGELARQDEYR